MRETWQRNKFDARQIGVHKAGLAYGASYVTVLPGEPVPVMRGASPRKMTVAYGDDDDWPRFALEWRRDGTWRLYDDEAVYRLAGSWDDPEQVTFLRIEMEHGARVDGERVTPVIRYKDTEDLDDEVIGEVEDLITLQDQINFTTFGLLVAQHFGAFKQRAVIGWLAETEQEKLKASASRLWTFEDHPNDVKLHEFSETDLAGYINSREASLRHLSSISQTTAHEMLGMLINLSADALASAEASKRRKITERQTVMGESHEQALGLAGELMGQEIDPMAFVRWRDTESRSLSATADALGKLVQMLGVPPQELWERVPGVSQVEVERWKAAAAEGDSLASLTALLDRQANNDQVPEPPPEPTPEPVLAGT